MSDFRPNEREPRLGGVDRLGQVNLSGLEPVIFPERQRGRLVEQGVWLNFWDELRQLGETMNASNFVISGSNVTRRLTTRDPQALSSLNSYIASRGLLPPEKQIEQFGFEVHPNSSFAFFMIYDESRYNQQVDIIFRRLPDIPDKQRVFWVGSAEISVWQWQDVDVYYTAKLGIDALRLIPSQAAYRERVGELQRLTGEHPGRQQVVCEDLVPERRADEVEFETRQVESMERWLKEREILRQDDRVQGIKVAGLGEAAEQVDGDFPLAAQGRVSIVVQRNGVLESLGPLEVVVDFCEGEDVYVEADVFLVEGPGNLFDWVRGQPDSEETRRIENEFREFEGWVRRLEDGHRYAEMLLEVNRLLRQEIEGGG